MVRRDVLVGPAARDRYKWIALSNTTVGVLLATIDSSIMLIAMPDIFRGIGLDPLRPENSFYLLWMILGYNPIQSLVGAPVLGHLPPADAVALTGRSFFPQLISGPFHAGLHAAFLFAIGACLVAAAASWSRGGRPETRPTTRR